MNIVKELCVRNGIVQKELASMVGVSQPTVSDWFNNKTDPSGERLEKLSKIFGVSRAAILGYDDLVAPPTHTAQQIDPHTYYAEKFGPDTQKIVDELLARLRKMPESKQEEAARGALTFVRGVVSADEQEGKA